MTKNPGCRCRPRMVTHGNVDGPWVFRTDGTYLWFLKLDPLDISVSGTYTCTDNTLACGVMEAVSGTRSTTLTISNNKTFSFVDDEGVHFAEVFCGKMKKESRRKVSDQDKNTVHE